MRRSLTWRVAFACVLLMGGVEGPAQAEPNEASTALGFNMAMVRTLENNPALVAVGYAIRARQAQLLQAGLRPNPQLGMMVENVLGTGDVSGLGGAETTLSLGWVLERGKRERRVDAARAGVSMLEAEAEIQRLDSAAETARLFLTNLALQERLKLTDDAVALADETVVAIRKRVEAGRAPRADLARAEAERARIQLDREDIDHELRTARRYLAAQWGDTQPDFGRVDGDITRLPIPDDYPQLLARLEQNPNIARYLSERRLRDAELRLAEAQAKPNWQLTGGIRRFERGNDVALVASINIPLAIHNRNQGRIAAASTRLAKTDADEAATRVDIETRLFALYQELLHSLHRAETLSEAIVPRLAAALLETERAYAAGRYSYLELKLVQAELLAARSAHVEASIDAHRRVIDIERLTGASTTASGANP